MSHFTKIQTKLCNLDVLKKTLSSLNLDWAENTKVIQGYKSQVRETELIIKQSNNYEIAFKQNGNTYELVADLMFWSQPSSVDKFLNQIHQRYAYETIVAVHEEANFTFSQTKNEQLGSICLQLTRYTY
jgi:hypothetical protein